MKSLTAAVIVAVLVLVMGRGRAEIVKGGLPVRVDSPLARREHPRLLLTRQMLPELRRRCRTTYAEEYRNTLQWADQQVQIVISKDWTDKRSLTNQEVRDLLALAVLWQFSGERRHADAALRMLEVYAEVTAPRAWTDSQSWREGRATGYVPQRYLGNIAVIYDLLHDAMRPQQRAKIGGRILDGACGRRNVPLMGYKLASFLGLGKAAGVLAVYGDGVDDRSAAELLADLLGYVHEELLPNHRVSSYRRGAWAESTHCGCFEEYHLPFFWFLSNATGHNYLKSETVYRAMGTWYVYNIFHFGPGPNSNVVPVSSLYHGGVGRKGNFGMPICAAGSGDGLTAWLVRQKWWQQNRGLLLDELPARDGWYKILFLDPKAEIVTPQQLPETALFQGIGWVSMRGSWQTDATFGHFKCGHWRRGEPAHLDNNSFYIYKNGPLAIDGIKPGTIDDPAQPGTALQKLVPYGRMTIAHNTITVYDPDEKIMGVSQYGYKRAAKPFPVNDGGQTFRPETTATNPVRLEQGRIIAYQTHRLFDYVCGDAGDSYHPDKLKHFTRQFAFLKPDCFVVFDRVTSTRAAFPKHWLLHSYCEPKIVGDLVAIDAPGEEADRGRLFCRTLLPRPANIEKFPRATLVRMGKDITPEIWKDTEESWRLEVGPEVKRADDLFLHVLHAADRSLKQMVPNEFIEQDNLVGAKLTLGTSVYEVTFNSTGPVGGHIKVTDAGNVILNRDLVNRIEDNYNGWKNDPRYHEWMTNPGLRIVIGEGDQDEYQARQGPEMR